MRETKYKEIGSNAKAIRDALKMTMEAINQDIKISRSYISEFEKGIKLPTAKYTKYLYEQKNVNLNFLFGGEGPMFRPGAEDSPPDFGKMTDEVHFMLKMMAELPHCMYSILSYFSEYQFSNEELLKRKLADLPGFEQLKESQKS